MKLRLAGFTIMIAAALAAQAPGDPDVNPDVNPNMDPPARVARLNWLEGAVSMQPAGIEDWTAAAPNYPLTTGDHLYTDVGARAEMRIGRNSFRLNSQSNLGFLNLDDRTVQIRFTGGAMEARLRFVDDQDVYEIDTPNGAISLLRDGDYRIDADPDRNGTMISVFAGEVEVTANGQSFPIHPREVAWVTDGAPPDIRGLNAPDDFDRFTQARNRREDALPPARHVNPDMVGYEDLDAYGVWREEPDYGWVWAPPVRAGWTPYREGHWAWVAPWGWTWVDDAPWGFAPFHYGRWAMAGGGWVWIPGAIAVRPVYAPALVAFVGGPRFSIGIGVGGGAMTGVAWFPLGPEEVYRPAYAVSPAYVRRVNVTNVTNVTNITNVNITNVRYVNQNVQGAATAVPQSVFASARPVAPAAIAVTRQQMANAQIAHTAPVAPQRESVIGNLQARVAQPRQSMMARQVVAKTTPPAAPVSFAAQQTALQQNQGRPLAPAQVVQIRQQQPAAVNNTPSFRPAMGPNVRTAQPATTPPAPAARPNPPSRFESRPPNASQAPAAQTAPLAPQTRQSELNRPTPAPATQATAPARPGPQPAARPEGPPPQARRPQEGRPRKEEKEKKE